MPDGSVMCSFTQATGPFKGRPRAPESVQKALGAGSDEYDMTGLVLENVHLRSRDLGATWEFTGSDRFRTCANGITGQPECALRDGTLVRAVYGPYLPYDDVPRTGYLQRSTDCGRTWGPPEVIYSREGFIFWPGRLRQLSDGRLLAGGGLIRMHPEYVTRTDWFKDITDALFVSDNDGHTWEGPIDLLGKTEDRTWLALSEEWDWAELPGGDLLCVLRDDGIPADRKRLQTRLVKRGNSWEPTPVKRAPFPHSGHPELLATRKGYVLHVATTAISCTDDEGRTWHDLALDDGLAEIRRNPRWLERWGEALGVHQPTLTLTPFYPDFPVPYYPKSVELANGEVLVVGHVGSDNGYGMVDQSIVGLRFSIDA
jgi:hypothetical protein